MFSTAFSQIFPFGKSLDVKNVRRIQSYIQLRSNGVKSARDGINKKNTTYTHAFYDLLLVQC